MDDSIQRSAPKWQKALRTVKWIIANLPPESTIQLYHFNGDVTSVHGEQASWVPVADTGQIGELLVRLSQVAPLGGTNLESPFLLARTLSPRPDNIILITDGLPTRGKQGSRATTIDGRGRARLFKQAIKRLPENIPLNIILFPVEGDPLAAAHFWKLAIDSAGSLITPTRDWP